MYICRVKNIKTGLIGNKSQFNAFCVNFQLLVINILG